MASLILYIYLVEKKTSRAWISYAQFNTWAGNTVNKAPVLTPQMKACLFFSQQVVVHLSEGNVFQIPLCFLISWKLRPNSFSSLQMRNQESRDVLSDSVALYLSCFINIFPHNLSKKRYSATSSCMILYFGQCSEAISNSVGKAKMQLGSFCAVFMYKSIHFFII